MATWLDSTLDKASADIEVNVKGIGLTGPDGKELTQILARPISAAEYQVLKSDPAIRGLTGEDRTEWLGLRMTYEMLAKCDSTLSWTTFQKLPLILLGRIAERVVAATGSPTDGGGGVLGE